MIRAEVADCLGLNIEEVSPTHRLIDDLGANSLDFIDLIFQIERRFSVNLRDGELGFLLRLDFSDPAVVKDGYLTEKTIADLRGWLPELDTLENPKEIPAAKLFSLIRVETLLRILERHEENTEGDPS